MADEQYAQGKITLAELVSTYYSFRFLPRCKQQLRKWCEEEMLEKELRAITAPEKLGEHTCDTVDVLTRVLLWCGDDASAMHYAQVALKKKGHFVEAHTIQHLTITDMIASLRFGDPREDAYFFITHVHIYVRGVQDPMQLCRVLVGYALTATEYDMLGHALKFGWRAVFLEGVTPFVRAKAMVAFVDLPFRWLRSLMR